MIKSCVYKAAGIVPGNPLPSYTDIGCYPIVYVNSQGSPLCADCVNSGELEDDVMYCDVHWEGESHHCDACEIEIESAYGFSISSEPV